MRKLIALLFALACPQAQAYDCFPSNWIPTPGQGTAARTTSTSFGYTKAWWCHLPTRQNDLPNKWYWAAQFFSVHNSDQNLTLFAAAATRVAAAADPLGQVTIELNAANSPLVPGSQKEYEYKVLHFNACNDLKANPPPGVVFDTPLPDDWCGAAPVPPATVEKWVTPLFGTFRLYTFTAGKLAATITGRTAAPNQTCDCTVTKIAVGTSIYCPLAGAASTEVTLCKKAP